MICHKTQPNKAFIIFWKLRNLDLYLFLKISYILKEPTGYRLGHKDSKSTSGSSSKSLFFEGASNELMCFNTTNSYCSVNYRQLYIPVTITCRTRNKISEGFNIYFLRPGDLTHMLIKIVYIYELWCMYCVSENNSLNKEANTSFLFVCLFYFIFLGRKSWWYLPITSFVWMVRVVNIQSPGQVHVGFFFIFGFLEPSRKVSLFVCLGFMAYQPL